MLVEQNAKLAMNVSHYTYVIDGGKVIRSGESKDIKTDKRAIQACLGKFATEK